MTRFKQVLVPANLNLSDDQLQQIRDLGYIVHLQPRENDPLVVDPAVLKAVICNRLFDTHDIQAFKNLHLIQLTSAGTDQLPNGLKEKGIQVDTARDVYSIPIAEWVILKVLELIKGTRHFEQNQQRHDWVKQRDLGELNGRKAVIVGFGSIGREIGKRLQAFGVEVTGVGRKPDQPPHCDHYILIDELDVILPEQDLIICTLPLTAQTKQFFNTERLNRCKPGSLLVNVSRGAVIDETALIQALQHGPLRGAALDVFVEEPLPPSHPFWDMANVLVTPHNSFASDRNAERLFAVILKNLERFATC